MAILTPGVLLKLLDGMISGVKPTSEYRNSLLQVADIMPVDLDEKDLWPKHGFYVKVSDSSHSIYVSLPSDLILSNEIQLGQFILIEKLERGTHVPVAKGVKPLPGRRPFSGMPEPLTGFSGKGEKINQNVHLNLDHISNLNSKLFTPKRDSWGTPQKDEHDVSASPKVLNSYSLKIDRCTPANLNPNMKLSASRRNSWVTGPKREHGMSQKDEHDVSASPKVLNSCSLKIDRCTPVNLNTDMKLSASRRNSWVTGPKREHGICESSPKALKLTPLDHCTPMKKCSLINYKSAQKISSNRRASLSKLTESPVIVNKSCVASSMVKIPQGKSRFLKDTKIFTSPFNSAVEKSVTPPSSLSTRAVSSPQSSSKTSLSFNLPQKLSLLGKEAIQLQERAQKIALQALRNASATESLVWSLKTLSSLTKSAKPDDPTDYFDQFLEFHNQIVQAIANTVSIKAATESTNKESEGTQILQDIMNNKTSKRQSPSHTREQKSTVLGKHSRSSGRLNDTIKLGKQIEKEAGNWFMEFLEKSLENGMKKTKSDGTKVPQLLVEKVVNWVEIEQFDSSKRPLHPKAIDIARKLRIKLRNS